MIIYLTANNSQQRQEQLKRRNRLKKIAKIKKMIGYFLILCTLVASHYMVLVISANPDPEKEDEAQDWAINYLISLAQDMGASQVFKVLLTVVCMRMMVSARNQTFKKVLKLLIDPVTVRALAMSIKT